VLSSAALGALLGLLGGLLPSLATPAALIVLGAAGVALAFRDLRGRTPTLRRQTDPVWWRTRGHFKAAFLWGFDLGLGFTTIRVASLFWIVLLAILLLGSPAAGAGVLALYGLALGANLTFGLFLLDRTACGARANIRALGLSPVARTSLVGFLVCWSAFLGARGIAG
jgi:hypothetical protein